MTGSDDWYRVGYGCPPRRSQWQRGQSPNPSGRPPKRKRKLHQFIESLLTEHVTVVEDGRPRRRTVFEVIVLRLWIEGVNGTAKAVRVLLNYQRFAKTKPPLRKIKRMPAKEAAEAYARHLEESRLRYEQRLANPQRTPRKQKYGPEEIHPGMSVKEASAAYARKLQRMRDEADE